MQGCKTKRNSNQELEMMKKILLIALIFTAVLLNSGTSFAYNADMAESSKCSRYFAMYEDAFNMPNNLIRAVAITESGRYVKGAGRQAWPWTVNAQGKGYHFASKREAIKAVNEFRAQGIKSIDVGCMQVNLMYHPEAFHSLEQAFEPKYNIGYAAQFLMDKFTKARNWEAAIGLYHSGVPERGKDYTKQVYSAWKVEDKSRSQVAFLDKRIEVFDSPRLSYGSDMGKITMDSLAILGRD
jgi:soluble lytic murein transglycosylase-like protein